MRAGWVRFEAALSLKVGKDSTGLDNRSETPQTCRLNFPQVSAAARLLGSRREDQQADVADVVPDGQDGMR